MNMVYRRVRVISFQVASSSSGRLDLQMRHADVARVTSFKEAASIPTLEFRSSSLELREVCEYAVFSACRICSFTPPVVPDSVRVNI